MGLYKRLENEMRMALKAGEAVKLSVLRMVIAAARMIEIEKNVKEIGDTELLQLLQKQLKQRKEAIAQFEKGKRQDLVDKESEELKILESYMPAQLGEEELLVIVKEAVVETGSSTKQDTGKAMKVIMPRVAGRADGKMINELLSRFLK